MIAPSPRIGIHVSIAGRLSDAVERAKHLGCEAMQIFGSSPRAWNVIELDPNEVELFKEKRKKAGIFPLIVHASYLINLTSFDDLLYERSKKAMSSALERCDVLEADYYVMHVTSPGMMVEEKMAVKRIRDALCEIVDQTRAHTIILLENTAGTGFSIGYRLEQIAAILEKCGDIGLGFCLDTSHALAAGYALCDEEQVKQLTVQIDGTMGIKRLKVIHSNDSRTPLGSRVDRHAAIGKGHIGIEGFKALLNNDHLKEVPFILETPGDLDDDLRNVTTLKSLRNSLQS